MSTLGKNGRFANQLFQYSFVKLYALRHGLAACLPEWDGKLLFGLNDGPLPKHALPELRFFAFDDDDRALWDLPQPPLNVDFAGYFQEFPTCWSAHRPALRAFFSLPRQQEAVLKQACLRLTDGGRRPLVAMHARRGDYVSLAENGLDWYRPIPVEAYRHFMSAKRAELDDPVFYLASDEIAAVRAELDEADVKTFADLDVADIADDLADFAVLRLADHLAVANSSFSRFAAVLAHHSQRACIFEPVSGVFAPYDAWEDGNFWQRFGSEHLKGDVRGAGPDAVMARGIELRRQRGQAVANVRALQSRPRRLSGLSQIVADLGDELAANSKKVRLAIASARAETASVLALDKASAEKELKSLSLQVSAARSELRLTLGSLKDEAAAHAEKTAAANVQRDEALLQMRAEITELRSRLEARNSAAAETGKSSMSLARRFGYGMLKGSLLACVIAFGWTSARLRAALHYAHRLLAEGQRDQFWRLIRHWLGRARPLRSAVALVSAAVSHGEAVNARVSYIDAGGNVKPKQPLSFPDKGAGVMLSIIIPCYNYGNFIREAVQSARDQTLRSLEIIIVENGSTDPHTLETVRAIECEGGVKVVWLSPNQGLPGARNAGIEAASGEYVCSLDADDKFEPTYCEKAAALLESDDSIGFAFSWLRLFGSEEWVWETSDFDPRAASLDNRTSVSAVFRRDDWALAGRYDSGMHGGYDDWEFWVRLASLGRRGKVIREPLLLHRKHGSNMTGDAHAKRAHWLGVMAEKNLRFFGDAAFRSRLARLQPLPAVRPVFEGLTGAAAEGVAGLPHMLVIVPWLPVGGGAEILLLDILSGLARQWKLTIVTTVHADHGMAAEFAKLTPEVYHLDHFLPEGAWLDFISMLIRTRDTSAVLSSGSGFFFQSAEALKRRHPRVRLVGLLHNDLPTGHIKSALAAAADIDTHLVITRKIAGSLAQGGVPPERIEVIENGVDTDDAFAPDRVSQAKARAALGIAPRAKVILFVGRMSAEKRPLEFVAIADGLRDIPGIAALMVGDGLMAAAVDSEIARRGLGGVITRLPHRSRLEMPELYAAADLLVLTSEIEGQPLAMLEALASGRVVAVTDVGDVSRVVTQGENGFIAPASEPERLTDYARAYFAMPAQKRSAMQRRAAQTLENAGMTKRHMLDSYTRLFAAQPQHGKAGSLAARRAKTPETDTPGKPAVSPHAIQVSSGASKT